MRSVLPTVVIALLLPGCLGGCHPIETVSRVSAQATVTTTTPIVPDEGPVVAMPLDGHEASGPRVAIVDVDGLLLNQNFVGPYSFGDNPVSIFREKLDAAASCADVRAVVVRISSPGGGVTATDMMWQELRSFRTRTGKPVIACLLDVAAGGAYYLATAADVIIAHPTALTGGIGVIWNSYNLKEMMLQQNISHQPIKAGPNIDMGTVTTPLTPSAKELLQVMANEFHERFKGVVCKTRSAVDPHQESTFDGRVFTATQALQLGLVDRVGYLEDAIQMAREAAGELKAGVVIFHRSKDPAYSPYSITPNSPVQGTGVLPISLPGIERSRLPAFLYLWQPDPTLERTSGR